MRNLPKKIELFISILIISFSVLLSTFLVKKFLFNPSNSIQAKNERQLNLPDINWAENSKTVVIALQTTCHFCNESAPFYKRLIESVKEKNIKIIAVLPNNVEESKAHLGKLGLADLEIRQSSLDDFQVKGTPTLIIFNNKGEVIDSWVGKLSPNKETEVFKKITPEG